ncbi:MAG: hypothetical protein U0031_18630 [Thermomicrobiales bacterium]
MNRPFLDDPNPRASSGRRDPLFEEVTAEGVFRLLAFGSAVFLLFGIFGDRTTEVTESYSEYSRSTDAAGYNIAATFAGMMIIVCLSIAVWQRPRIVIPTLSALLATAAFALSIFASGIFILARSRGEIFSYASGTSLTPKRWDGVYPAVGPFVFAPVSVIGAIATLVLIVIWLRRARQQ